MDGGTGGITEPDSDTDSDTVAVQISVHSLPSVVRYFEPGYPVVVHTIRITTSTAVLTFELRGLTEATTGTLLAIAAELASAAVSRYRRDSLAH